jgi:thiamine-phosphate pyrophosphorylase
MTDERLGGANPADALWRAIARLPRGAGIVVRHHGWPRRRRRALARRILAIARRRRLRVLLTPGLEGLRADGWHWPAWARGQPPRHGLLTRPLHAGPAKVPADVYFLSPAFPTRSHPGQSALGPVRFGLLAHRAPAPVVALGGMNPARQRRLAPLGASGFAAIDYWASDRRASDRQASDYWAL